MSSSFAHHHGSLQVSMHSLSVLRRGEDVCAEVASGRTEAVEEVAAAAVAGPTAWGARLLGDGFSVEELLDLEELCEVDKEDGFLCETAPATEEEEEKCSDSHGSSAVSYELMPLLPPEMDLPARRGGTGVGVAYHGRLAGRAPASAAAPSASGVATAAPPAAGKRRAGRGPYADPDNMRAFH
ncbi:hypothetical protein ZWY2020_021287 [Hordeum vulgare]|nr:hypothetical protein ZWY2020_021287 [Hordeum vulgare]